MYDRKLMHLHSETDIPVNEFLNPTSFLDRKSSVSESERISF